jgi:hypothetical protein
LSTRAGAADTAANLLRRIRALRGVAGVKSVAPLADVLEATEDLARGLEFGEKTMNGDARQLLETSAEYLRVISSALRFDGDFNAPSAARDAFLAAQSKWMNQDSEQERVVPISTLFYSDGGPDVIEASPNPPTSTVDRFRLELVSHGEHLRQVVDTVRQGDASARSRRDLSRALSDLQAAAESFGERDLAEFVRAHSTAADRLDPPALGALDDLAAILSAPGAHGERLTARLRELHRATEAPVADHSAFTEALGEPTLPSVPEVTPQLDSRPEKVVESEPSAIAEPVAVHEPEPVAVHEPEPVAPFTSVAPPQTPPEPPRAKTPAQAILSAASSLIDMSLAALDSLTSAPWLEPEQIAEDDIVPIESLLYRGSAALERAIEIRDELRQSEIAGRRRRARRVVRFARARARGVDDNEARLEGPLGARGHCRVSLLRVPKYGMVESRRAGAKRQLLPARAERACRDWNVSAARESGGARFSIRSRRGCPLVRCGARSRSA